MTGVIGVGGITHIIFDPTKQCDSGSTLLILQKKRLYRSLQGSNTIIDNPVLFLQMWPTNKEKQIIEMNIIKVKNPSWQKADQLAIYKRGQAKELTPKSSTVNKIQPVVRAGIELMIRASRFQHSV